MKITEKVKLLEDTTVAWANAHGELLATLSLPRNRDRVRAGRQDAVDELFRIVDEASAKHRRMKARLRELNES